jgi:hypothetical protein
MAVPSGTIQAVARVGVREDLSDRIGELFPDDCPFQKAIGTESASQVYHEWQTDKLAAASSANKTIQGDDLANDTRANTVRQGNYTQIMKKVVGSSTTMEASRTAGRASELGRELMKAGRELKTDAELRYTSGLPAVPPAAGTAGETAGAMAFIVTNSYLGTAGSPTQPTYSGGTTVGYPNAAAGNGTQRTYTETLLKAALAAAWTLGGNPKLVITDVGHKQIAAAFTGLATQRRETGDKRITIVAGADFYVSDVGEVQFVPSRFCSARDALIIDPEYWAVAELDPLKVIDLAKTGLATRKAMYQETALVSRNEAASAVIRDLT